MIFLVQTILGERLRPYFLTKDFKHICWHFVRVPGLLKLGSTCEPSSVAENSARTTWTRFSEEKQWKHRLRLWDNPGLTPRSWNELWGWAHRGREKKKQKKRPVIRSEYVLVATPSDPDGSPATNVLREAGYLVSSVSRRDSCSLYREPEAAAAHGRLLWHYTAPTVVLRLVLLTTAVQFLTEGITITYRDTRDYRGYLFIFSTCIVIQFFGKIHVTGL